MSAAARPLSAALLCLALAGCATTQDWAFVQSVGGIAVGAPQLADGEWLLPVSLDVSGLRDNGVKPAAINSGIGCKQVKAKRRGHTILLTLHTQAGGTAACPPARLGHIDDGEYAVKYGVDEASAAALSTIRIQSVRPQP